MYPRFAPITILAPVLPIKFMPTKIRRDEQYLIWIMKLNLFERCKDHNSHMMEVMLYMTTTLLERYAIHDMFLIDFLFQIVPTEFKFNNKTNLQVNKPIEKGSEK